VWAGFFSLGIKFPDQMILLAQLDCVLFSFKMKLLGLVIHGVREVIPPRFN
jgi:hypothetical protein